MKDTSFKRADELAAKVIEFGDVEPSLENFCIVKKWLSVGGSSVVYGASNAGKTFAVLDIAWHVATGTDWRGYRVRQGPVFYIAGEGGAGICNRLAALRKERPQYKQAPIYLLPVALDLHGEGDALAVCQAMPCDNPALIVVDTLARSMGEGDENSTKDMGRFVANIDYLRAVTGAHVLVIHHSGKDGDKGARGSSALKGAVDTEIKVTSEGEIICPKQRDMPKPNPEYFSLKSVTLGVDEDGDDVTSAVVIEAEPAKPTRKPLKGKNEVAMQALYDALRDHGERRTGDAYPANRKVVSVGHWREACNAHGLTSGTSESAARTAFMRAKTGLMDLDEVREFGGHVWRVHDD